MIAFLTSAHPPLDDRIFYHFAKSLIKYNPVIISSIEELETTKDSIIIDSFRHSSGSKKNKIIRFVEKLNKYNPNIIICSEPITIIAAHKYNKRTNSKARIIFDITEWYPSKKNIEGLSTLSKLIKLFILSIFNIYSSIYANAFIFGEYYKSIPYRILFPFKKNITVSYYPDLKYLIHTPPSKLTNEICMGYSGKLSKEKGIFNFMNAIQELTKLVPEFNIKVKIIGEFASEIEKDKFNNQIKNMPQLEAIIMPQIPFEKFSCELQNIDLFFDLRAIDFENTRCLPIKLFYYMACERPVIYSNLKAINHEIKNFNFGYLVNPHQPKEIAALIHNYIINNELYMEHSKLARINVEKIYNWNNIKQTLTDFIDTIN